MVDSIDNKEKRIEDIEALLQPGQGLNGQYAGKKYMLHKDSDARSGGYQLYVDYSFTASNQDDRTQEVAGLMQVPEVIVQLDSCLNIVRVDQYRGGTITQQTVNDVMDKMIRDTAEKQLRGGK